MRTEGDFQGFFAQWKIQTVQCRDNQGEYNKGDKLSDLLMTIKMFYDISPVT